MDRILICVKGIITHSCLSFFAIHPTLDTPRVPVLGAVREDHGGAIDRVPLDREQRLIGVVE
jgi:hypothetical protein